MTQSPPTRSSSSTLKDPLVIGNLVDNIHSQPSIDILPAQPVNVQPPPLFVRVVAAAKKREYWSDLMVINSKNQGRDLINKLQERGGRYSSNWSHCFKVFVDVFLMQQDCVLLLTVSLLYSADTDIEAQSTSQRVYIEHSEHSESLTQAYLDPEQLQSAKMFVSTHLKGVIDDAPLTGTLRRQALYVDKTFSAKLAVVWFGVALVLSIGVGVAVSCGKKDMVIGLAVGFGILSVLGPAQMILAWQLRSEI